MSVYARLNYNWKSRYYLTVTGRYDGASNFAANNKWAFFPSAAVKWNLANENFLKDCDWIDDLSIRVSAGLHRQRRDQHLPFAGRALVHHRRLSVRRFAACRLLPQPSGFARPDMGEDGRLQRGHRLVDVQRTPEHHGRSLQIQDNRSAHVAGRSRPDGLHLALDQYRLDVEQAASSFRSRASNIVRPNFDWTTTLTMSHNDQMVDDIGYGRLHFVSYDSPRQQQLHDVRIRQRDTRSTALWGFKYGGIVETTDQYERKR